MIFKIYIYKNIIKITTFFLGKLTWKNISNANNIKDRETNEKNLFKAVSLFNRTFKKDDTNALIKMENISKIYSNKYMAVNNFNLNINPQEFVCLLGPSGCGKTTLLRMAAGLESITKGKYIMNDIEMNSFDPSERNTSMVFQNYALYPFMNVYKNVSFGLKLKTYNNHFFNNTLERYILQSKPNFIKINALKNKVFELKNPFINDIKNKKVEIKKAKIRGSKKIKKLIDELIFLKEKKKEELNKNIQKILILKKNISTLKTENVNISNKAKVENKRKKFSFKEEKKKLLLESRSYFLNYKRNIPKIKLKISKLKKEKKNLLIEYKKHLGKIYNGVKFRNFLSEDASKLFDNKKNEFKEKVEKISNEIQENEYKVVVIKNKNLNTILEAKNSMLKKISLKSMLNLSVIWKKTIFFRIVNLSKIVGLENFLNRKPSDLSGGQRQRVALMRAISKESKLFLFDEPLSNLDAKLRTQMRQEIKKIHEETKATSLYVTHDQIEAMTMADKVVVMNNGFVQQIDSPTNLYDNPANLFVAKFIGNPSMNFFDGIIKNNKLLFGNNNVFHFENKLGKNREFVNNKKIKIGIRPQNIRISKSNFTDSIKGKIKSVEITGAEIEMEISLSDKSLIRIVSSEVKKFKCNDQVFIKLEENNIHIFDQNTNYCLSSKNNDATIKARKIWEENFEDRTINDKIINSEKNKESFSKKIINKMKESGSNKEKIDSLLNKINNKIN